MPGTTKATARIDAVRAALDERSKANVTRRQELAERLASGDVSALAEAKSISNENADIESGLLLAADASQLAAAALRQLELEKGRREQAKERDSFEALKARRLSTAEAVERLLRSLASKLVQLEALAEDVEAAHRRLGGERLIVPPLSRSAVGSRISEFCTGLGLNAWLPVICAETKSPPASLEETERLAQAEYRLPEDR